MEIEAKLSVPDEQTLTRLLETPTLAGYRLGPLSELELHDVYQDTPQRALLAAGYALRRRHAGEGVVMTLKGLGSAGGGIHRRAEYEVPLPAPTCPERWPSGPLRDIVLEVCGPQELETLLRIDQVRRARRMCDGDRQVADMSGDEVWVHLPGGARSLEPGLAPREEGGDQRISAPPGDGTSDLGPPTYLELEIELLPDGTDEDLARVIAELRSEWPLGLVSQSKFHRALALLDDRASEEDDADAGIAPHLTPEERACLAHLAEERAVLARRARLLLAWDEGASLDAMLARSGLSARRARFWRRAFRKKRMGIFPAVALPPAPPSQELEVEPGRAVEPPPLSEAAMESLQALPEAAVEPLQALPESAEPAARPRGPAVGAGDPMSTAGRRVLAYHFQRVLQNEPGTRTGIDIEALHDMRVATRRMRAAFRVFGDFFEPRTTAPFLKALRRTGRALGEVRDLDVFEQKTDAYMQTLPVAHRNGLDAFLVELRSQRDAARKRLLRHLDGAGYQQFVTRFAQFVESPESGSAHEPGGALPRPCLVRHVAPVAIMERLAAVRAFEGWVDSPGAPLERYHALRIAAKRLRYTLEFFADVLGRDNRDLIAKTVALQDHLGLLQDGVVASGILRDFLVWGTWGPSLGRKPQGRIDSMIAPGVAMYLAARQTEMQDLMAGFPAVWATIAAPRFRRDVAAAVGAL